MAAVYKSVSKKQARQLAKEQDQDEEDLEMEDFLGPDESSDSEEDEEDEEDDALESAKKQLAAGFMPKTRVLMLTSRGVTHRYGLFSVFFSFLPRRGKQPGWIANSVF